MHLEKRNPAPLAGGNRASESVHAGKLNTSEDTRSPNYVQARRARFARAMAFDAFGPRAMRLVDEAFVDRPPAARRWA